MTTVMITGGSSGIGYAFAEYYGSIGYDLILTSRKLPKLIDVRSSLQEKYLIKIDIIQIDLSESGSAQILYDKVQGRKIDILINNAGVGYTGISWRNDIENEEKMTILNDASLMSLTKLMLRDMTGRKEGTILNIASTGAFQPGPYIAGYYASKSFVYSYTRAVHEEAKNLNVKVFCLCPGPVDTEFYGNSGLRAPASAMSPERCVRYTVKKMRHSKCLIIPGAMNKLSRYVPVSMKMKVIKRVKQKAMKKQYQNKKEN